MQIPTYGSTDQPNSALFNVGRYKALIEKLENFSSKKGNPCIRVGLNIDGRKINDIICLAENLNWRWLQILYAVGIRRKLKRGEKYFNISAEDVLNKMVQVDIGQKPRELDDGSSVFENVIRQYLPVEIKEAPIKGIEPEPQVEKIESKPVEVDKAELDKWSDL